MGRHGNQAAGAARRQSGPTRARRGEGRLDELQGRAADTPPEPLRRAEASHWGDGPIRARGRPARASAARERSAVGYLRRSTDRQEQSIPDQQRAVEAYCAARGLSLLRCYVDDAISGTQIVHPVMSDLLHDPLRALMTGKA